MTCNENTPKTSFHLHSAEIKTTVIIKSHVYIYIFFYPFFLSPPFSHSPFLTFSPSEEYIICYSCSRRTSVCPETHQSQHAWLLPNSIYVSFSYLLSTCLQTSRHFLIYSLEGGCARRQSNMMTMTHLNVHSAYVLYQQNEYLFRTHRHTNLNATSSIIFIEDVASRGYQV